MTGSNLVCVWSAYRTSLITRLQSHLETPEDMLDRLKRPYTLFVSLCHLSNKQQPHGLSSQPTIDGTTQGEDAGEPFCQKLNKQHFTIK